MEYGRLAEKMSDARRHLMLPHPNGEEQSIVDALWECSKVLNDLHTEDLDDSARAWVDTIRALMDADGQSYVAKAHGMTLDDKYDLRGAVDELATWARRKSYGID